MEVFKSIAILIGIIAFVLISIFGLQVLGLMNYQFFGPKFEDARRNVFENTQSYRQGSIRDFDNLYLQYVQAKSEEEKAILLETIRHRASGVPVESIPARVQQLIAQ